MILTIHKDGGGSYGDIYIDKAYDIPVDVNYNVQFEYNKWLFNILKEAGINVKWRNEYGDFVWENKAGTRREEQKIFKELSSKIGIVNFIEETFSVKPLEFISYYE